MITFKEALNNAIRDYDSLSAPRLLVTTLDQEEIATLEGDRFGFAKTFSSFDIATPIYVLIENPSDSGVVLGISKRSIKTDDGSMADFQILWDYDVSTATKTAIPVFNQNNYFRATEPSALEVSLLNISTTPTKGNWPITGAATILDEGIEREGDFLTATGQGSNKSGTESPELGFRIYMPNTGFLIKMTSASNSNRVLLSYDWLEAPVGI